ncbi:MAG: sigma-70 family RNA polymerase sigma factor [Acidobacteriaceae bacterium]|nr:sigma-70 family RNA polymerase sigma factor [Acidobacteriaceae bacterium]MBV9765474.1 sigma-70 family RNA polymerase sigma factor [Acidobacteriaceae bacterium]
MQTYAEVAGTIAVRGTTERAGETALIRSAQQGDAEAFEQLVRAYDQNVLRMALNLLHSQEDARDIYQEAFLRVYRNLPKFRFDCSFSTWLYRIVANLCLDQLRKRKVRSEEPAWIETSDGQVDRFQFLPEQRADVNPERQLASTEVNTRIREVLDRLTPRERLVFEMRHFQGMRLRAIGEALGVTEEAAKNCLFRATQKMRAALGDFV